MGLREIRLWSRIICFRLLKRLARESQLFRVIAQLLGSEVIETTLVETSKGHNYFFVRGGRTKNIRETN